MKIVKFKENGHLEIGYWGYKHHLPAGVDYVFFDKEIGKIAEYRHLFKTRDLSSDSKLYKGQDLTSKSLLFISLGGYGDALCFLQAINSLQNKYPSAQIDISTHMDIFMFVRQFSYTGGWLSYPLRLDYLEEYDYYQSSDSIYEFNEAYKQNVARLYARILNVEVQDSQTQFSSIDMSKMALELPCTTGRKIGIQVNAEQGATRDYPKEKLSRLVRLLCGSGLEVFLVGTNHQFSELRYMRQVHDYIDSTPTVLEFAGILSQMDIIITPDSVGAHIGGILGIPTIVLFNATGPEKTDHYSSIIPMRSSMSCSPCYDVSRCRLGNNHCEAFYDASVGPEVIYERVLSICQL